ncbi:MAG: 1,4-alpha-glucan branching protein GlgB [Deltaproteobacteria bacterium]|nr:1,4-alpha-glucan branching protein GlgB [Deltaproteobacteria bacterium]
MKYGSQLDAAGAHFRVWAPRATDVSLIGDFNDWKPQPMKREGDDWTVTVPGVARGALYKYVIRNAAQTLYKADPWAFRQEIPPGTASVVWSLDYTWNDAAWMKQRAARSACDAPVTIYEVHLGSWMRVPEDHNRSLTYRELAPKLVEYVTRLGFTHVELMPLTEHPFYGSWGYETTGYFAPTARYGTPEDLMALIDALHAANIAVILDWVPAHFPNDPHGLARFDGGPLYEHPDPRLGFHPEWNTCIFDFGRTEVRDFLLASARFWIERYHVDGLRVDGVASMLYRDYGRKPGDWLPNNRGGNEYFEAVELLQRLNDSLPPDAITLAEESTAWPHVTGPTREHGLGFSYKWDMGWMHDTLAYLAHDPIHRKHHHHQLTFRGVYAFAERFVMPLSHDEVVYGKGSLLNKMPGDDWQKFANLRLLYAYLYSQPGKKLLFMGSEFAQWREWNHDASLDWHLLDDPRHRSIQLLVGELNRLYRTEPALHEHDCDPAGFHWLDADDTDRSLLLYERRSADQSIIVALNFTPVPRPNIRAGVEHPGLYSEILNTDARELGGSGHGNLGGIEAVPAPAHGRPFSLNLTVPPLGAVYLRR